MNLMGMMKNIGIELLILSICGLFDDLGKIKFNNLIYFL